MRRAPISVRVVASQAVSLNTSDADQGEQLSKALIGNGALVLQRLMILQDKGWQNEAAEQHFQRQRHTADNCSSDLNNIWFLRMKKGMFEFALEPRLQSRFKLTFANLTYYQLGTSIMNDGRLLDLPTHISDRSYGVVLLDGHQLRTQIPALPWDGDRLLISQMIIALEAVKEGGTIVVKLPLPHKPLCAKILYLLRILSTELSGWKPVSMHGTRGTFYAVAKGVGNGQESWRLSDVVAGLRALWVELTFGGEDNLGRFITSGDFDFLITMDDLIAHHLDWLTQLGTPLWAVQEGALTRFFFRNNIV